MIVKEVQSLLISLGESQAVDAEILIMRQWEALCFVHGTAPSNAQIAAYLAGRRGAIKPPETTRARDNLITTKLDHGHQLIKQAIPDLMAALDESLSEVRTSDEPSGTCVVHGDYWTTDCEKCVR